MRATLTRGLPSRPMVLLAPANLSGTPGFGTVIGDEAGRDALLSGVQRLRGRIYLNDGAIEASQLTADGRHVQAADNDSWHLLVLDDRSDVGGCVRYRQHPRQDRFADTGVSRSALAHSEVWGGRLHAAVESEMQAARQRGAGYVELGGWALAEELRSCCEALRLALTTYALARLLGGALGISTATRRHHSSSILRKVGGRSLVADGVELPAYYDPQYKCEMEVLRFDSSLPEHRYEAWIEDCGRELKSAQVFAGDLSAALSLDRLRIAVGGDAEQEAGARLATPAR